MERESNAQYGFPYWYSLLFIDQYDPRLDRISMLNGSNQKTIKTVNWQNHSHQSIQLISIIKDNKKEMNLMYEHSVLMGKCMYLARNRQSTFEGVSDW